jgi:DtxR family Mn-dependent transcriptional regulator
MPKSLLRQQHHLSEAVEDYLKAIYLIREAALASGEQTPRVTTTALADYLDVAPGSVTGMIKKLAEHHLVEHTPYHGVVLTPTGEHIALELVRHHRLIELYLTRIVGFAWDEVHEQADALEHAISEELEDRIAALLGEPTYDPHGDPIPSKEGHLLQTPAQSLADQEPSPARRFVLARVLTQDAGRLRYLAQLGLVPGARIALTQRDPFGGAFHILRYDPDGTVSECLLSDELARLLFVRSIDQPEPATPAPG